MNTSMRLSSGVVFDFSNSNYALLTDDVLTHHLAQTNRFNGACSRPYSVLEHSLLVARIFQYLYPADSLGELCALMHDAHEAVTGDLITPWKHYLQKVNIVGFSEEYEHVQNALLDHRQLLDAFNRRRLDIKRCDTFACLIEQRDLLGVNVQNSNWPLSIDPRIFGALSASEPNLKELCKIFKHKVKTLSRPCFYHA